MAAQLSAGSAFMPKYRTYQMDQEGRVIGLPNVIACDDDEMAIKKAKLLGSGHRIDVWNGDRLVARIPMQADRTDCAAADAGN
jgi:hypothetical protein